MHELIGNPRISSVSNEKKVDTSEVQPVMTVQDVFFSRLSMINKDNLLDSMEAIIEESDLYSGGMDPDSAEAIKHRNSVVRDTLQFLLK
jgi:hypothetical protein